MSHREQAAVEEDASLGKAGIGSDWKDAHPLWNAEVLLILQHHQTATAKEETPRTQSAATQKLLQETLQYVRSLNNYHSQAAVDEAMLSVGKHTRGRWMLGGGLIARHRSRCSTVALLRVHRTTESAGRAKRVAHRDQGALALHFEFCAC